MRCRLPARTSGVSSTFPCFEEACQTAFRIVGLPPVPQDLGPKPSAYLGKWVKNPRRGSFIRSKKTRGHRGANKDSAGFLIVPFQCLSAPRHFFLVLEIPAGIVFDPHRPYQKFLVSIS